MSEPRYTDRKLKHLVGNFENQVQNIEISHID
jgi:hypothetical protein